MCRSTMKPVLWCASLLLAGAAPSSALSLAVLPAHPVEGTPFTLVIGLVGSCPVPDGVIATPGHPGIVTVTLRDICLSPPGPTLVEVPIGPLTDGPWSLRVQFGVEEALLVEVEALPFAIDFDPPSPQAGSPFILRLTGSASCYSLGPAKQDGNLLTLRFIGDCPILPPPPSPFVIEQSLDPLSAGDYVVQVIDTNGSTLVSRRLHVFSSIECVPSETALCLQQGRFRVEATWRTGTAQGVARAHPETADSGAFWFFGPDNLELLVKVLDACPTQSQATWVFAAGLTDVEVEIIVTEMATGKTQRYRNPLGRPFAPILDTKAFSCLLPFPGS
jgi:hypothetical protein